MGSKPFVADEPAAESVPGQAKPAGRDDVPLNLGRAARLSSPRGTSGKLFEADGVLRAVGDGESGLLLQLRRDDPAVALVRIAQIVEVEQLRGQVEAAVMALALLAVDSNADHGNSTGIERGPRTCPPAQVTAGRSSR